MIDNSPPVGKLVGLTRGKTRSLQLLQTHRTGKQVCIGCKSQLSLLEIVTNCWHWAL